MHAVYIIDDEPDVRDTMSWLVEDMGCANQPFASGSEFLDALPELAPGCMLVDLHMPQVSGIELIRATSAVRQSFPAVMISGHPDVYYAVEAMKAGAIEILQKPISAARLKEALDLAAQTIEAQPPERLEDCIPLIARKHRLTRRQTDVLHALVAGRSNKLIAVQLGIATRTVEMHRAAVMAKLGVHNLPALLRLLVAETVRPPLGQSAPRTRG